MASERLLLIDTCGETAGVCLSSGMRVLCSENLVRGNVSAQVTAALRRLLDQAQWRLTDLHAIGVVSGPGSFTGIRAGLAAAKGLCEAGSLPLCAVSRLAVLAHAGEAGEGLSALDAGRGELYLREEKAEGAREWLWTSALMDEFAGRRVVVAEDRVAELLRDHQPVLRPLHVMDAVPIVLRQLHEGSTEAMSVDANYVREERDIYRKQVQVANPASGQA